MGYEKTEPRNNQILLWGIVSVVTLFALVPLFHSYYGKTFGAEFAGKVYERPNTEYDELVAEQRGHLREAPLGIDQAMDQLATRGRAGTPVMPRPNDTPEVPEEDYEASLAPLVGWSRLENVELRDAALRAMRWRREQLLETDLTDDVGTEAEATSLEAVQREELDPASFEVEERPPVRPAENPVRAPMRPTMRPSPMGGAAAMGGTTAMGGTD
jgi:hypothetical protein